MEGARAGGCAFSSVAQLPSMNGNGSHRYMVLHMTAG
jgi:hypothetical protein